MCKKRRWREIKAMLRIYLKKSYGSLIVGKMINEFRGKYHTLIGLRKNIKS